jgi:alkylation response protein AidB-like acyl-CoA dehydrogenase
MSELDALFGDPWDPVNPVGHAAVVAADERQEMLAEGERLLDAYRLNAEFVPVEYGGRLRAVDELVRTLRAVWRRDPALGLGYGVSSFIASVNVWAAGDDEQCRRFAGAMMANRKIASVYHELAHGNDFARAEFAAERRAGELRLTGRKEVVTNVQRADSLVIFARTSDDHGSRSHSQLFVHKADLPQDRFGYLPRFHSMGMRGVQLGGIEFRDCPVPETAVLGTPGAGIETALRSFQLTRTALPAMMTGILDTGLRTTLRFAEVRRLYGKSVATIPVVRDILAEAFTDLLICDAMGTVGARALHLLPEETSGYASLVKYVVSKRLIEAMDRLSLVLGAHFYIRQGEYAIFQKLLRDLAVIGFGHAARVACLGTVLPQMPRLARRSWTAAEEPPAELFVPGAPLPPLAFDRLRPSTSGDRLSSVLLRADDAEPRLAALVKGLGARLAGLRTDVLAFTPRDLSTTTATGSLRVASEYADLLAASACLGVWRNASGGFLADPAWITAALTRLSGDPLDPDVSGWMTGELLARYDSGRGFDLTDKEI